MTPVGTPPRTSQDAQPWRVLRPITIFVTDAEYEAIQALLDREPRRLPGLVEYLLRVANEQGTKPGSTSSTG